MDPMAKVFMELYPSFDQATKELFESPDWNYQIEDSPFYQQMCRELVEIRVDPAKCTSPSTCLKCLGVCSQRVFAWEVKPLMPIGDRTAYGIQERPARMVGAHQLLCTLCNRCAEHCPQQAITVIPGSAVA